MFDAFLKRAVGRLLWRGVVWIILCLIVVFVTAVLAVATIAGEDPRDGLLFAVTFVQYPAVGLVIFGSYGTFRLQRTYRAASRIRRASVDDKLSLWGEPSQVRASLDHELSDGQYLHIDELCPVAVTRSWVVQVSQHGISLARIDEVRGFRLRFRPIWPFTSVGDYHITVRIDGHDSEVFLIDKDRHLDIFLAELIACNEYLNSAFRQEYYDFPEGLTGRDIVAGHGPPDRRDVSSYIQERTDRMKSSGERTWVVGER